MDVIVVNGREVIKCVHCNGSGVCEHSMLVTASDWFFRKCSYCGESVKIMNPSSCTPPICKVCEGKGHVVIG